MKILTCQPDRFLIIRLEVAEDKSILVQVSFKFWKRKYDYFGKNETIREKLVLNKEIIVSYGRLTTNYNEIIEQYYYHVRALMSNIPSKLIEING